MREYIYLPEAEIAPTRDSRTTVDRPVAVVDAVNTTPVTLYVHADHLHRPVRMTNAAKAAVWDVIWTPWGAPHTITGAQTLNARFPGQWFQLEAGLHYNWHRHYDPSLGRYTQPDPLGFVDGPSVYAYARNMPIDITDLDGRKSSSQSFPPDNSRICLSDNCQRCLKACEKGQRAMEQFCRTTPMLPQVKALCWAASYVISIAGCKGYCYNNHCADVPL